MRDASEHDSEEDQDADHDGDDEVGDDDESDVGDQESDKEESEEDQNDKEQENAEGEGSSDDEEDSEDNQGASSPFFPDNFTELFGKPELEVQILMWRRTPWIMLPPWFLVMMLLRWRMWNRRLVEMKMRLRLRMALTRMMDT